jgi:hypothetical protein
MSGLEPVQSNFKLQREVAQQNRNPPTDFGVVAATFQQVAVKDGLQSRFGKGCSLPCATGKARSIFGNGEGLGGHRVRPYGVKAMIVPSSNGCG